jgi:hypothetical protein
MGSVLEAVERGDSHELACLLAGDGALTLQLDERGKGGNTALILAAQAGYKQCVVALLQAGADSSLMNEQGHSPLMAATLGGRRDCIEALVAADMHTSSFSASSAPQYVGKHAPRARLGSEPDHNSLTERRSTMQAAVAQMGAGLRVGGAAAPPLPQRRDQVQARSCVLCGYS